MEPKYILVENPLTGKHVNILPLFQYFQDEYPHDATITPVQATEALQEALDFLAVSLPTGGIETHELARRNYVNDRLITLRNTFSDIFKQV